MTRIRAFPAVGTLPVSQRGRHPQGDGHPINIDLSAVDNGCQNRVVYPPVLPQVDLRLEARPGGLKETLVLQGKDAPARSASRSG